MDMFNPPHPGEIIREDCLVPLGLTVTRQPSGSAYPGSRSPSC